MGPHVSRAAASAYAVAIALTAAGFCAPARAQDQPPTLLVQLSAELPRSAQKALRSALAAQAAEVQLSVEPEQRVGHERVVKVERASDGFALGFFDAKGQLLSDVRVVQGSDEVSASEVATIVHALAVAWRESTREQQPPAPTTPPVETAPAQAVEASSAQLSQPTAPTGGQLAAQPSTSAREDDGFATKSVAGRQLALAAMYTGINQARQLGWHSGVRGELTYRFASPLYLGLSYAHLPTTALSTATASFSLREHALNGFVGGRRSFGWVELGSDVGLVAALTQRSTGPVSSELIRTPDAQSWRASVSWRVRARLPFGTSRFALDVAPAVAINLIRRQMTIHDATETAVFTPYWLQTRVDVGISYSAL